MNKRPLGNAGGLPAKPAYNNPHMGGGPGPAPPLPQGPPPPQLQGQAQMHGPMQPQQQQQQQNQGYTDQHAAAWAAYYQSQGIDPSAAYAAAGANQPQVQNQAQGASNPYSNYGYGSGAQHAFSQPAASVSAGAGPGIAGGYNQYQQPNQGGYIPPAQQQQQQQYNAPHAGPSGYRPPPIQNNQNQIQNQNQNQGYYSPAGVGGANTPGPGQGQPQGQYGTYSQQAGPRPPPYNNNAVGGPIGNVSPMGNNLNNFGQPGLPAAQGYNNNNQGAPNLNVPYRPQNQPQSQPQLPNQPFYPQAGPTAPIPHHHHQQQPHQSFRPQTPPRPSFQTQNQNHHQNRPPGNSQFPPAKRPRFDGPGTGGPGAPAGPSMGSHAPQGIGRPPRPPVGVGVGVGVGINNGQPGFPARPPVSAPTGPASLPQMRPPIHLGMGGPPPNIPGLGIGVGVGVGITRPPPSGPSSRGPSLGGPRIRPNNNVVIPNAPRGPASQRGLRAGSNLRGGGGDGRDNNRLGDRDRREKDRKERELLAKKRERDREMKTTMTDFRIVGVEIKGLPDGKKWEWGLVGEKAKEWNEIVDEEVEIHQVKEEVLNATEVEKKEDVPQVPADSVKKEEVKDSELKNEEVENAGNSDDQVDGKEGTQPIDTNGDLKSAVEVEQSEAAKPEGSEPALAAVSATEGASEAVNGDSTDTAEKVGEKRKATSSEIDEESSKKRPFPPPTESITDISATQTTVVTSEKQVQVPTIKQESKFEKSQNRFRIYFESPPELDRIPKAVRRGNKRWRRESSSVAPSRVGDRENTVALVEESVPEKEEESVEVKVDVTTEGEVVQTQLEGEESKIKIEGVHALEAQEGGNADQQPEVVITDTAIQEQPAETTEVVDTAPEVSVPVQDADAPSVETVDTGIPGLSTTAEILVPQEPAPTGAEEDQGGDEDISMMTDPGFFDAILEEMAQTEAALLETAPQDIPAEDASAVTTDAPTEDAAQPEQIEAPVEPEVADPQAATKEENGTTDPPINPAEPTPEQVEQLAKSAEATASAYKTRTRRHSSVSDSDSVDYPPSNEAEIKVGVPSTNRISVLFEESNRRVCLDADVVEKVKIYRAEGKIEVLLKSLVSTSSLVALPQEKSEEKVKETQEKVNKSAGTSDEMPKGFMVETYDSVDQRFVALSRAKLEETFSASTSTEDTETIPPLHHALDSKLTLTVYVNKRKALSEPKWCRNNTADEWLYETLGSRKSGNESGWKGKLEVVDPDPAPTLQSIFDAWISTSSSGKSADRKAFTASLLSDPNDLLEILLRLTRGERNPTMSNPGGAPGFGSLASAIRADSPYASHQTHVSLAILAMYRLTTDYAIKAGEGESVKDKVADIVRSLPVGMITKSLDGLFKEWGEKK